MSNQMRPSGRWSLLVLPLVLGAGVAVQQRTLADDAAKPNTAVVYDYADQITRLVESRKIEELAKLQIPATDAKTSQLQTWASSYVSAMQRQEGERDKQYAEAVNKAEDLLKREKFSDAMDRVVQAYQITKDPDAFLKLDWVKDLTAKIAAGAGDMEKKGQWLESFQLYTDLNALYEIDTRYKPDMQRLGRRIRLLAMYAPKTLFEMRKAYLEKMEKETTTAPATQSATEDTTNFPKWEDQVEGIKEEMATDAIERSKNDWVEVTSYETLLKGGVEALRLFLTTPELAKEFPGLADKTARESFEKALDGAVAGGTKDLTASDVGKILQGLVDVSNETVKLPEQVILLEFTDGAMEKLDPFTAVIWPHELDEFEKTTRGYFGGVGISIGQENGQLKVISPLEDTPAYKAGIEAGDIITAIDGKPTLNMSIDQAVHTITGKPGTDVTLKIKRAGVADKDYVLTRDVIKVASVKGFERDKGDTSKWNFMIDPDNKIGYVRLTQFQDETAQQLRDTLVDLQNKGMKGLIMDLRFNPGGLLNSAIDISDMFLQDGAIVSTQGRSRNAQPHKWRAHKETVVPMNMPIVVLVNQYSASASEIFSGAMKDLHRALIVGHRSFGKGSVQNLLKIGSGQRPDGNPEAMMKLTMAYYYLPNGESLHRKDGAKVWGVDPDVVVDLTPKQITDLLRTRRDSDVIHRAGEPATTAPATTKEAPSEDTQLDTAVLMLRLQLVQSAPG
jgi:carboxyl-terminal processing protease